MNAQLEARPVADGLDVVLGPLRRRHLRSVMKIEQQVYPRPWSMGLFMSELGYRTGRVYLCARVDTRVVGYAGLMLVPDDGHVTTIAVDPPMHGHHIGTRLLHTLARAGVERGAKHLTLEVRVGNDAALSLYRNFGFAPAGIRKGYYQETGEDAIVMWAHDVDAPAYLDRIDALAAAVPGTTTVEELDP
ncbi:MAG: ribosomal protein S18-alanine N-acetyltransferase [Actinomycetota bacterium]|nr:ribosomal protein S18-alanine N-acetyltransferase [Actinomycetota bacterium]